MIGQADRTAPGKADVEPAVAQHLGDSPHSATLLPEPSPERSSFGSRASATCRSLRRSSSGGRRCSHFCRQVREAATARGMQPKAAPADVVRQEGGRRGRQLSSARDAAPHMPRMPCAVALFHLLRVPALVHRRAICRMRLRGALPRAAFASRCDLRHHRAQIARCVRSRLREAHIGVGWRCRMKPLARRGVTR